VSSELLILSYFSSPAHILPAVQPVPLADEGDPLTIRRTSR